MKKLNKLEINSEKIMKNEELLSLRGGYDGATTGYKCLSSSDAYLGCVNLVNCDSYIGTFYCHSAFPESTHVTYTCGTLLQNCHVF